MASPSKKPAFNMKVVVQETGLGPDTLRAWERRYGLPAPHRTPGRHRLYSQFEIDMLKWLVARQDEGLNIRHAVELWQQLEAAGQDPFEAAPGLTPAQAKTPAVVISGEQVAEARGVWFEACLAFGEDRARHILAQAFALFPVETVCFEILLPALHEIGAGWFEGRISVQQEHFASVLALRQLEALLAAAPLTQGHDDRLLVACPPGEEHTFGPLLLTLMLRRRGWEVVYLGANVPLDRLADAVQRIEPRLVILAAQTLATASSLLALANLLEQEQVTLAFGGAVFTHLAAARDRIPGHFLGPDLQAGPDVIARLVQTRPPLPAVERPAPVYGQALAHFAEHRPAIETELHQSVNGTGLSLPALGRANEELGANITAVLTLGNMDLLDANIDWVQGLLVNDHDRMPVEMMTWYANAYAGAVKRHLDERGQVLKAWFQRLIIK